MLILTTNQKVAGSSPAEPANKSPANQGKAKSPAWTLEAFDTNPLGYGIFLCVRRQTLEVASLGRKARTFDRGSRLRLRPTRRVPLRGRHRDDRSTSQRPQEAADPRQAQA